MLGDEEKDDRRHGDHKRPGHEEGLLHGINPAEQAESYLEGVEGLVVEEDKRGQEIVPGGLEGENGHCNQGRAGKRQDDIPQHLKSAGAVDFG